LYDIELTNDNGYVVINKFYNNHFTKLDSNGNIQWQIITDTYTGGWTENMDITPCGNNEFIVSKTYGNSLGRNGLHIYKINISNHQIIWDTTYNLFLDIHCLSLNQVMGVEVSNTGDIVVWATSHINPAPYVGAKRGAILKLNAQGDSLWARYYEAPSITWSDDLQLNDLIIAPDGGYMGVGYQRFSNGKVMAWLFKTDANGTIGWPESSTPKNSYKAKVYPNPAHDYTTLQYNCRYVNMSYTISDMQGKSIVTKVLKTIEGLSTNEVLIDLGGLSPGNYQISIKTGTTILYTEKLIITK